MKRFILSTLYFVFGICSLCANANTDVSQYSEIVYIEDVVAKAGDQLQLSVNMKNATPVIGFNFKLYCPEGVAVKYQKDKWGDTFIDAFLSGSRTSAKRHTFETAIAKDGALNVLCYSMNNYTFDGTTGKVASITVQVSPSIQPGTYPIIIRNEAISMKASTPRISYIQSSLTIVGDPDNSNVCLQVYPLLTGEIIGPTKVKNGNLVTYTAISNTGYEFSSWLDGLTENPREMTITTDTTVAAIFSRITHVHDTTYINIHDTTFVDRIDTMYIPVHDTTYIDRIDTLYIDRIDTMYISIHDTTLITVHDTTYIDRIDTLYIDRIDTMYISIHDTTLITVHDTTYIDRIDTLYIDRIDTMYINVHDTTLITVHDTTYIDRIDTLYIDRIDTMYINVHDTTYINIHDTTYIDRIDTLFVDRVDTMYVNVHDTTYINVHDTTYINIYDTTYINRIDTLYIDRVDTMYVNIYDTTYINTLSVESRDSNTGKVEVQLYAIPELGYKFLYWSDFDTSNPRVIDISDGTPKTYTAIFDSETGTNTIQNTSRNNSNYSKKIVRNGMVYIVTPSQMYDSTGKILK